MHYAATSHSAKHTGHYVFSQLIPYIGNKRKLLGLLGNAFRSTGVSPKSGTFLDAFSGSSVVSRFAKQLGFEVTSNDWEPYAQQLGKCFIENNVPPTFFDDRTYESVIAELNALPPLEGWITSHLCPSNDDDYDVTTDRLFYMRKNGMRIDAVREKLQTWQNEGRLSSLQLASILGPLLYQACWLSNTSGVFKGFHNGWGGQTGTALYRIKADFCLEPAIFEDNGHRNSALRLDATELALDSRERKAYDIAYLDPPYNQHPYGSNYHVLNTISLWDSPPLSRKITGHGNKSAIRQDWKTERRSAYNHQSMAATEYRKLMSTLNARFLCTSYSTDGFINLKDMIEANRDRGEITVFLQGYKRYRVSSQRFSEKPMNVEFVLSIDTSKRATRSIQSYVDEIQNAEHSVLSEHPENSQQLDNQGVLF